MTLRSRLAAILLFLTTLEAVSGAVDNCKKLVAVPPPAAKPTWWKPKRRNPDGSLLRFQYQLSDEGTITYVPGVQVYIIDIDTACSQIPRLKSKSKAARVVCYFSAGSFEIDREAQDRDYRGIKRADWGPLNGKTMAVWTRERWVDVRRPEVRRVMKKRMQWAKQIGCDGVDPDNVNSHEITAVNGTGFPLTRADLVNYNKWLASTAHSLGLAIGLKNAQSLIRQVEPFFEWAVNEECNTFEECGLYDAFAKSKPILGVEYCDAFAELDVPTLDPACFCPRMLKKGFSWVFKRTSLDAAGVSCAKYCKKDAAGCRKAWPADTEPQCKASRTNMCGRIPAQPLL